MERQMLLDSLIQQVESSNSFQKIMEDGQVTDSEIQSLSERINSLMVQVENKLSADDLQLVSELLTELTVFHVVTKFNEKVR